MEEADVSILFCFSPLPVPTGSHTVSVFVCETVPQQSI